jgi:hypothetical protein
MPTAQKDAKLVEVKLAMAQRYEQRAMLTQSIPRRKRMLHHAKSYRRQAVELSREVGP